MLPTMKNSVSMPSIMDRFFADQWMDNFWNDNNSYISPSVNIREDEKNFHVEIAAPGIEKKDIQVNVEEKTLVISYEHNEENEKKDENKKFLRREFSSASFSKSFTLPDNVDTDKIEATYKNGVLFIEIPKAKEKSKLLKMIKIS